MPGNSSCKRLQKVDPVRVSFEHAAAANVRDSSTNVDSDRRVCVDGDFLRGVAHMPPKSDRPSQ
jgi:hypothetical protein